MSVFCSLECYHVFFGIFILGLLCTSFCALPKTPIFSFYCNLMLQIWVHLSTLRHMWSGWCLKFLCWHTLLIFLLFFCGGTSFLCAAFTNIMTMMDRGLTWMMLYTTLVNSKLYKNSINVYIILVLKLNRDFFVINYKTNLVKISLSARIIVLSPNRYISMKPFIDHQKFMESFSLKKKNIYIVTCLVQ